LRSLEYNFGGCFVHEIVLQKLTSIRLYFSSIFLRLWLDITIHQTGPSRSNAKGGVKRALCYMLTHPRFPDRTYIQSLWPGRSSPLLDIWDILISSSGYPRLSPHFQRTEHLIRDTNARFFVMETTFITIHSERTRILGRHCTKSTNASPRFDPRCQHRVCFGVHYRHSRLPTGGGYWKIML